MCVIVTLFLYKCPIFFVVIHIPQYLYLGSTINYFFLEKGLRIFFFLYFPRPHPQIINGRPLIT